MTILDILFFGITTETFSSHQHFFKAFGSWLAFNWENKHDWVFENGQNLRVLHWEGARIEEITLQRHRKWRGYPLLFKLCGLGGTGIFLHPTHSSLRGILFTSQVWKTEFKHNVTSVYFTFLYFFVLHSACMRAELMSQVQFQIMLQFLKCLVQIYAPPPLPQ